MTAKDSSWLLSWTVNRRPHFKAQPKDQIVVWVYGLFIEKPGDYVKKPMQDCTGEEISQEWLYHMGVPVEDIPTLAATGARTVPVMMPYITAFFIPRQAGDRPDVVPESAVNFAFIGQFAESKQRAASSPPNTPCARQCKPSTHCSMLSAGCPRSSIPPTTSACSWPRRAVGATGRRSISRVPRCSNRAASPLDFHHHVTAVRHPRLMHLGNGGGGERGGPFHPQRDGVPRGEAARSEPRTSAPNYARAVRGLGRRWRAGP